MAIRLADLAVRHGCELHGDPDLEVSSVATLQAAGPGTISFLANLGYKPQLAKTGASAVIIPESAVADCPVTCLVAANPYAVYARIAAELHPPRKLVPGVHATAVIGAGTDLPDGVEIAPGAVLGNNVVLGEGVCIGPNCVLEDDVNIGRHTRLVANVTVCSNVRIGARCILHPGAVVGSDGFGNAQTESGWVKVPQVGGVSIGDDVEIGANSTVDRGAIEDTVLANGVRIDNLVQIGHNARIGEHSAMAAMSGISGSSSIGARCVIGGHSGVSGHISITDDVVLMGRSSVSKDIAVPGFYASVLTVEEAATWRRLAARFKRLDKMAKQIKTLEDKLKKSVK